jgi:hypothetical protein
MAQAADNNIPLVDYHTALEASNAENYITALTLDGVHPSSQGYTAYERRGKSTVPDPLWTVPWAEVTVSPFLLNQKPSVLARRSKKARSTVMPQLSARTPGPEQTAAVPTAYRYLIRFR